VDPRTGTRKLGTPWTTDDFSPFCAVVPHRGLRPYTTTFLKILDPSLKPSNRARLRHNYYKIFFSVELFSDEAPARLLGYRISDPRHRAICYPSWQILFQKTLYPKSRATDLRTFTGWSLAQKIKSGKPADRAERGETGERPWTAERGETGERPGPRNGGNRGAAVDRAERGETGEWPWTGGKSGNGRDPREGQKKNAMDHR
jgi:hypothetical protein